jgi:single-strand DNA-binding protein
MASFNKVILMGNLTKDPRLASIMSGSTVCEFSIAINRRYTANGQEKEEVCFVDIVVWGRQADSCGKYLHKGSAVFVEGRLKTDSWEDKEGNKRSRLRVAADRVQFIGSRSEGNYNRTQSDEYSEGRVSAEAARSVKENYSSHNQVKNEQSMPVPPQDVFEEEAEHEDDIPF